MGYILNKTGENNKCIKIRKYKHSPVSPAVELFVKLKNDSEGKLIPCNADRKTQKIAKHNVERTS